MVRIRTDACNFADTNAFHSSHHFAGERIPHMVETPCFLPSVARTAMHDTKVWVDVRLVRLVEKKRDCGRYSIARIPGVNNSLPERDKAAV